MRYDPSIVISIARAEIGYHEKATNKDLDDPKANAGQGNWTKYARDLDAIDLYNGHKNGITGWCDIFVDFCFVRAYGVTAGSKLLCQPIGKANCGAGPKYSRNYFAAKKQLVDDPQPGDQVFFHPSSGGDEISHTGLVAAVDASYIYTIEGNTSGGQVAEHKYGKKDKRLAGFGRPDWGMEPQPVPPEPDPPEPDPPHPSKCPYPVPTHTVRRGMRGDDVRWVQWHLLLWDSGSLPRYGLDGSFGAETDRAVRAYQDANGLKIDGLVGPKTIGAMITDEEWEPTAESEIDPDFEEDELIEEPDARLLFDEDGNPVMDPDEAAEVARELGVGE